jgi:hypothetical protein
MKRALFLIMPMLAMWATVALLAMGVMALPAHADSCSEGFSPCGEHQPPGPNPCTPNVKCNPNSVPEPGTLLLLGVGGVAMLVSRRRGRG